MSTWGLGATVTYSFAPDFTLITSATAALSAWDDVANIHFAYVESGGDITFHFDNTATVPAYAYFPGSSELAGDVFINTAYTPLILDQTPGSYGYSVMLHETGHAIGLEHTPVPYSVSVMSGAAAVPRPFPSAPLPYDIAIVQALYGANPSWLPIAPEPPPIADLQVYGTPADDVITGGPGNDDLNGDGGADWFVFGDGHDEIYGWDATDRVHVSDHGSGDFDDVSARLTDGGSGAVLTIDPDTTLTFIGVPVAALVADQFLVV